MSAVKILPLRKSSRRIVCARVIIAVLLVINLSFIWYNSSKESEDSDRISNSIAKSVEPYMEKGYGSISRGEKIRFDIVHKFVRKSAHVIEFVPVGALLLMLWLSIFEAGEAGKLRVFVLSAAAAVPASFLFAMSDELHQLFVDGRGCCFSDMCIDTLGAFTGYIFIFIIYSIFFNMNKRKKHD